MRDSADRKPERCAPPSWVLMLLANVKTESWKPVFHCRATSTSPDVVLALKVEDGLVYRVLGLVDVLHEVPDAALVLVGNGPVLLALVDEAGSSIPCSGTPTRGSASSTCRTRAPWVSVKTSGIGHES